MELYINSHTGFLKQRNIKSVYKRGKNTKIRKIE